MIVANQNGKLVQRISTDYETNSFRLEPEATLDLASGTTPSGAPRQDPDLRPDNAPICPIIDSSSRLAFVTLRGGGLFVLDGRASPMQIIAEYDRSTIHGNGCGGLEAGGKMYVNSGGAHRHQHVRVRRLRVRPRALPQRRGRTALLHAEAEHPGAEARREPGRPRAHRLPRRGADRPRATSGWPIAPATASS